MRGLFTILALIAFGMLISSFVLLAQDQSTPPSAETLTPDRNALIQQGSEANQTRHYDIAVDDFTKAIELNKYDPEPFFKRGFAYLKLRKYDKAIPDFSRAILMNPKGGKAYALRAEAYVRMGNREAALADLKQVHILAPKVSSDYVVCSRAEKLLGLDAEARDDLGKALEIDPNRPFLANDFAWWLATCPDASIRDGKKAVQLALKACEDTQWKFPAMVDTLAAAYAETGDFENAIKYETQFLQFPNLGPKGPGGQERLELYRAHKPFHQTAQQAMPAENGGEQQGV